MKERPTREIRGHDSGAQKKQKVGSYDGVNKSLEMAFGNAHKSRKMRLHEELRDSSIVNIGSGSNTCKHSSFFDQR